MMALIGKQARMLLCIGQVQQFSSLGNQANQSFPCPHGGLVHGCPVKAFGGV